MNSSMAVGCTLVADGQFGPIVDGCREDFDFTLMFEQYIFTLLPASILLAITPFRLRQLYILPKAVKGAKLRYWKIVSTMFANWLVL